MNNKLSFAQSMKAGLLTAAAAIITNVIIFFIFKSAGIFTDNILIDGKVPLAILPIVISSTIPTLIAALVFFLFEKFSSKGYRNFSILSVVLVILSLFSPFSIPKVTTGFALGLGVMHLTIVFYLLYFLKKAIAKNAQ
jgi:hypothetical protein